jgi:hypothetical protein
MRPTAKTKKTTSLNLRVAQETKDALLQIGERESRNMVNTVEWLVAEYHRKNGLPLPKRKKEGK